MTAQEIFDTVIAHLLQQGRPSFDGDHCRYRLEDLKCAVGCLIPDDQYAIEMEHRGVNLHCTDPLNNWVRETHPGHFELLRALQSLHDDLARSVYVNWRHCVLNRANFIASQFKLQPPAMQPTQP